MTDVRVQNPEPLNPEPRTQKTEDRREKKRSLEVKKLRG
jgi:hypothetical protein